MSVPADQVRAFLKAQLLVLANQTCFDCNRAAPTHVDVAFGVFVCSSCCALHRGALAVPAAVAKAFDAPEWAEGDLLSLQLGGNARSREYFERSGQAYEAQDEYQMKTKYESQTARYYRAMLAVDVEIALERGADLEIVEDGPAGEGLGVAVPDVKKQILSPRFQDNDMEGYLLMFIKGGTFRRMRWSYRYFVLKDGVLHCFKKVSDPKPLSSISTASFTVGPMTHSTQKNCFELAPLVRKEQGVLVAAPTPPEMQLWVARLIQKGSATLKEEAADLDLSSFTGTMQRRSTIHMRGTSLRSLASGRNASSGSNAPRESIMNIFPLAKESATDLTTDPYAKPLTVTVSAASGVPRASRIVPAVRANKKEDIVCVRCDTPILDETGVLAQGQHFHTRHFHCSECKEPLKEAYYEKDGRPFCLIDYNNLFVPQCAECREYILDGDTVQTKLQFFHADHFKCVTCGQPFKDKQQYMMRDGRVYCEPDYTATFMPRCTACNLRIREPRFITLAGDQRFHVACMICAVCHKEIGVSEPVNAHDGKYLCGEHAASA